MQMPHRYSQIILGSKNNNKIISYLNMKLLVVTSLLFLTNFIHNTWYREFPYAWLFLLLSVTSIFIHSGIFLQDKSLDIHNKIVILDKIIIISIFTYGFYLYWKSGVSIIPIISVLSVAVIYLGIYGQEEGTELSHALMHIIGCLGHHFILYDFGYSLDIQEKISKIRCFFK